jgi:hypothetical protein
MPGSRMSPLPISVRGLLFFLKGRAACRKIMNKNSFYTAKAY